MKFEPLVLFSAIYNPQNDEMGFAEYDSMRDNLFMGTFHFVDVEKGFERIRTIWYDFYTKEYYDSNISLSDVNGIIDESFYIDICYSLGGTLLIWVISSSKSYLIQPFCITTNRIDLDITPNDEWLIIKEKIQHKFDIEKERIEKHIQLMKAYIKNLMSQYTYKYVLLCENRNEDNVDWQNNDDEENILEFDYIEEALFDGTHDKLHDGGLLKYHQAGKPKKLAIKWHIGKSEYTAYFWFEDEEIRSIFDRFYGPHPETKTDFIIRIDSEKNKYELALYHSGLREPKIMSETAYQLIVFKNKFEYYRSENYNQPRGAWIW